MLLRPIAPLLLLWPVVLSLLLRGLLLLRPVAPLLLLWPVALSLLLRPVVPLLLLWPVALLLLLPVVLLFPLLSWGQGTLVWSFDRHLRHRLMAGWGLARWAAEWIADIQWDAEG